MCRPVKVLADKINWADGTTSTLTNITSTTTTGSGHIDNFNLPATDHCIHNGQNFTITGNSVSYYNTTNFYSPSTMVPLPDPNCGDYRARSWNTFRRVTPPARSASSSTPMRSTTRASILLTNPVTGGSSETLTGPYQGPWIVWQSAMARGGGTRLYDNIGPYNSFTSYGGAATVVTHGTTNFNPLCTRSTTMAIAG